MAVLELRQEVECLPPMLLLLAAQVARDLAKQPEPLAVQAACPELRVLQALRLLLAGCLGKAAAVVVQTQVARAVLAVLAVVALAAVAVAQHAVHTPLALVVLAAMAGHWYWSFDYAAICRC